MDFLIKDLHMVYFNNVITIAHPFYLLSMSVNREICLWVTNRTKRGDLSNLMLCPVSLALLNWVRSGFPSGRSRFSGVTQRQWDMRWEPRKSLGSTQCLPPAPRAPLNQNPVPCLHKPSFLHTFWSQPYFSCQSFSNLSATEGTFQAISAPHQGIRFESSCSFGRYGVGGGGEREQETQKETETQRDRERCMCVF